VNAADEMVGPVMIDSSTSLLDGRVKGVAALLKEGKWNTQCDRGNRFVV
jgi:hypothetical protein